MATEIHSSSYERLDGHAVSRSPHETNGTLELWDPDGANTPFYDPIAPYLQTVPARYHDSLLNRAARSIAPEARAVRLPPSRNRGYPGATLQSSIALHTQVVPSDEFDTLSSDSETNSWDSLFSQGECMERSTLDITTGSAGASNAFHNPASTEYFLCPIGLEPMSNPVIDPEGNTYEDKSILRWLFHDTISPLTRSPLYRFQLVPNRALQVAIIRHKDPVLFLDDVGRLKAMECEQDGDEQGSTCVFNGVLEWMQSWIRSVGVSGKSLIGDTSIDYFVCPLTMQVMNFPVIDHEGNSYEREAILHWLSSHRKNPVSPITGNRLYPSQLVPNRALKSAITRLREVPFLGQI